MGLMGFELVIISDFDESSRAVVPLKDNTPLLVNPDAIKAFKVACKFFESIARRDAELIHVGS